MTGRIDQDIPTQHRLAVDRPASELGRGKRGIECGQTIEPLRINTGDLPAQAHGQRQPLRGLESISSEVALIPQRTRGKRRRLHSAAVVRIAQQERCKRVARRALAGWILAGEAGVERERSGRIIVLEIIDILASQLTAKLPRVPPHDLSQSGGDRVSIVAGGEESCRDRVETRSNSRYRGYAVDAVDRGNLVEVSRQSKGFRRRDPQVAGRALIEPAHKAEADIQNGSWVERVRVHENGLI